MSYEYNREDSRDQNREEGFGRGEQHSSHHQGGNVETGGYGRRDAQPSYGGGAGRDEPQHGDRQETGYNSRQDRESGAYNQPRTNYNQRNDREDDGEREEYGDDGPQRSGQHQASQGYNGGGRHNIHGDVNLDKYGDAERPARDAYGGEGLTDDQTPQHGYGSSGGRNQSSSSNNQGSYGSMNNEASSGSAYVSGSGGKWKPGQKMEFPAAEAKSEENPYAGEAQVYASDTQNLVKEGVKELESWAETKAKEMFSGGNK